MQLKQFQSSEVSDPHTPNCRISFPCPDAPSRDKPCCSQMRQASTLQSGDRSRHDRAPSVSKPTFNVKDWGSLTFLSPVSSHTLSMNRHLLSGQEQPVRKTQTLLLGTPLRPRFWIWLDSNGIGVSQRRTRTKAWSPPGLTLPNYSPTPTLCPPPAQDLKWSEEPKCQHILMHQWIPCWSPHSSPSQLGPQKSRHLHLPSCTHDAMCQTH